MRRVVQSIGALFAGISLTLLLVSILTTQWVVIRVDRERAPAVTDQTSELSYWSHDRGLYRECWLNQNLNPSKYTTTIRSTRSEKQSTGQVGLKEL